MKKKIIAGIILKLLVMVFLGLINFAIGVLFLTVLDIGVLGVIWCLIGIIFIGYVGTNGYAIYLRFQEMKNNLPIIDANFYKAKEELKNYNFNTTEHYSSFGYNYIEYRNCYNAKDNVHIEIDKEKKLISYYMLLPYKFILKSFDKIIDVRVVTENEIKAGRRFYSMIAIFIQFEGEDEVAFSVSDNVGCYEGDENCNKFLQDAEKFKTILLSLKEETL